MYISSLRIEGYRCFRDSTIEFQTGINVIIGENNAGKTAVLKALGLVFDRKNRRRIDVHDFNKSALIAMTDPPTITVTATLLSTPGEPLDDKALVATWLTRLASPWEAKLTYKFFLPEEQAPKFMKSLGGEPSEEKVLRTLEEYLPKFVARIYAGVAANGVVAESDSLNKIDCTFLDAIRDVETELFAGTNPLLRNMVQQILDSGVDDVVREKRKEAFRGLSEGIQSHFVDRLNHELLFKLVEHTGANDGGSPHLRGGVNEADFIAALKLFIKGDECTHPATHNGLGYNNLIYISLILASLDHACDIRSLGQNAVLFPILLIEEPEAHLHPALQYRLLKYMKRRLDEEKRSRQIFITTHSTQVTAASGLGPIICMAASEGGQGIRVAYPARAFSDDAAGVTSRNYIERYLDATKSNMLFTKGVIFVEGLAEQLLFPSLAECVGSPLEENHVAVVTVGGSTFLHFLPLFGAGTTADRVPYSLTRKVAFVADADPARKRRDDEDAARNGCWPYQVGGDHVTYEYFPTSGAVENLRTKLAGSTNAKLFVGTKTLEYDLAYVNYSLSLLVTEGCVYAPQLRALAQSPHTMGKGLTKKLVAAGATLEAEIAALPTEEEQKAARFATCYLLCSEDDKGIHAFELERNLRENHAKEEGNRLPFVVPGHLRDAVLWACRKPPVEALT